MHKFVIKMDKTILNNARKAVANAKEKFLVLHEERENLLKNDTIEKVGTAGIAKRDARIADINESETKIIDGTLKKVHELSKDFESNIKKQINASPENIKDEYEGAFNLLHYGLIATAEELHEFMEKYKENPALRNASTQYAKDHKFCDLESPFSVSEFEWDDRRTNIFDFSKEIFSYFEEGAKNPLGYWAMWCESGEDVISNMVLNHNLSESYQ